LSDYPYKAKDEKCKAEPTLGKVKAIKNTVVPRDSVAQLKAALAIQPTCVSVDASSAVFQLYSHGVFNSNKCGTELNHAVTAVGYGNDGGDEYVIVRNSWGAGWGENGYIRIAINEDGTGVCGVLADSNRPTTD